MIYLKIAFYIIAIMCIIYVAFRPTDVISWWLVKGKKVYLWIRDYLKGFSK